jgi:hypothetical protein
MGWNGASRLGPCVLPHPPLPRRDGGAAEAQFHRTAPEARLTHKLTHKGATQSRQTLIDRDGILTSDLAPSMELN